MLSRLLSLLSFLLTVPAAHAETYTVKAGDTLYRVARDHATDAASMMNSNRLNSPTLRVGQTLTLPGRPAALNPPLKLSAPAPLPVRQVLQTTLARPAGLPRITPGPVQGPVAWRVTPSPTVASFIGYLPSVIPAAFGNMLPVRTYLSGLAFSYQTFNNCGPSALSSVLGFYKANVSQDAIRLATRRDGGYMQVSAIAPELAQYGLRSLTIRNGQLDQVKRLLSLGIPVIVLQWLDRPGHINHFRVVRGYDDQAGLVWVSDSMVGDVAYLSYADFDALWNTQGRQMFPVYPKGFDRKVRELL